jgi:hypothetical protein
MRKITDFNGLCTVLDAAIAQSIELTPSGYAEHQSGTLTQDQ